MSTNQKHLDAYRETLLTMILMVYKAENKTTNNVSFVLSRAGVNTPFFKKNVLPKVPNRKCTAVRAYGNGKFPAKTSLLYIVNARLEAK